MIAHSDPQAAPFALRNLPFVDSRAPAARCTVNVSGGPRSRNAAPSRAARDPRPGPQIQRRLLREPIFRRVRAAESRARLRRKYRLHPCL